MNTTRYNSFNQIHKGLRAFLYDTALQLQQCDLSEQEAGEVALKQVEDVLMLFEGHAHNEDHFYNQPLEKIHPEVAAMFEQEHEEDHRLSIVLHDLIQQWRAEKTASGRVMTGRNLYYAFTEFIAFNLYHMNKEEIDLNAVLWKEYTDEQIKATERTIVQQTPPEKMMHYARWMIRGINNTELVKWFAEVQGAAPAEVYSMLIGIAGKELSHERFGILQSALEKTQHAVD